MQFVLDESTYFILHASFDSQALYYRQNMFAEMSKFEVTNQVLFYNFYVDKWIAFWASLKEVKHVHYHW